MPCHAGIHSRKKREANNLASRLEWSKTFFISSKQVLMSLLQREMTFNVKIEKILCKKLKMHFNIFSGSPDCIPEYR